MVLEVHVFANGRRGSVRVLDDAGSPRLLQSALESLEDRNVQFDSFLEDGLPVDSFRTVVIRFTLPPP